MAADLHGSALAAQLIRENLERYRPDVFVAAGDITNFGPVSYAEEVFRGLAVPTLAVPGNCDPRDLPAVLDALGVNLHGRKSSIAGRTFVGIGGSNPTPFGTPFELSEEEIRSTLSRTMEAGAILVSHPPPNGAVDVVYSGEHVGSVAVREAVEKYQPPLVLCGHIHEARGIERIGPTTVVNPGPARTGHSAVVEINGDVAVELL